MQTPDDVVIMDRLWTRFKALLTAALDGARALAAEEQMARGVEGYELTFRWEPDESRMSCRHIADDILSRLVALAERTLPPPGAKLSIERSAVAEYWTDRDQYASLRTDFSPRAVWAWLEQTYGGERAAKAAFEQSAFHIVREFGLQRNPTIKRVGGAVELTASAYTTKPIASQIPGGREFSYHTRDDLVRLVQSLLTFLAWTGDEGHSDTARCIKAFSRRFVDSGSEFVSRTRVGGGRIQFTVYFEKICVRITDDLAGELNQFVSTFSPQLAAEGAAA